MRFFPTFFPFVTKLNALILREDENSKTDIRHTSTGCDKTRKKQATESKRANKIEPIVLVHGGAGNIPDSVAQPKLKCVKKAASVGFQVLRNGGTSAEAVEAAIRVMEDDPIMNAGYGSVLNSEGEVETDACIMIGENLSAGGVTGVKDISHPISLAKLVMEKTPHVLLAGEGAKKFARSNNFPIEPPGSLVTSAARAALEVFQNNPEASTELDNFDPMEKAQISIYSTVGAVAIDTTGKMAAGVSTGGLINKLPGRIGDSAQVGHGLYCDDNIGAVSLTGHGEAITRYCLSARIIREIENGKLPEEAMHDCIKRFNKILRADAGGICISNQGVVGIYHSTPKMSWAYQRNTNEIHSGVDEKDLLETLNE